MANIYHIVISLSQLKYIGHLCIEKRSLDMCYEILLGHFDKGIRWSPS